MPNIVIGNDLKKEIDEVMNQAQAAFKVYKKYTLKERADFMRAIADELEHIRKQVIPVAMEESHLQEDRLNGELSRTIFQLKDYGLNAEKGTWLDARINKDQPKEATDIRKMLIPIGPVVVFGSSNFPFAYSTAGGDTACAFAAGCPVIVKAHPAHEKTSEIVANAINKVVKQRGLPEGVFSHVSGSNFKVGEALVQHPYTQAIGFTGSLMGGRALFDLANQRTKPIPVFAEMGSVNPVFLLPDYLKTQGQKAAKKYADSITQGVGQFCTNPGLIFGIEGPDLKSFIEILAKELRKRDPKHMLHPGIAAAYSKKRKEALAQKGVTLEAVSDVKPEEQQGEPTLASTTAEIFLNNPVLHKEIFGPYSLIVKCKDEKELMQIPTKVEGQLTSTLMATDKDWKQFPHLIDQVREVCGRMIMNGVPTGVAVCTAMQHGGPYPATTDSRFTSVGSDGIRRFARPIAFQNFPDPLLPKELQDSNPLGIWRTVNDKLTKEGIA